MNKSIIYNKQTTRKFQDQYDNCASKMVNFDSNIDKFILFYRKLMMMLKARGNVLTPRH